jgi:type IV pilus assembly protein PilF
MSRWIILVALLSLGACTHALRDPASTADAERRASARLELAKAYFAEGSHAIALEEVNHALDVAPSRADALGLRALALMRLGESEQATQSMEHALRLAPDDPALQNNMGWLLCETGKAAEGLPYFDRALSQRRYSAPANAAMNAGICSLRLSDRERAERYFQRALQAEPGLLAARVQLARLSIERGDDQQARRHFKVILASGYGASQDYALAVDIERRLGDRDAERSIAAQWKRLFPESPQLQAYLRSDINER